MRNRLKLNSLWQFQIDRKDVGESQAWYQTGLPMAEAVEVPHIWQSNPNYTHYCGTAWYQKSFEIKEQLAGKRLFVCFGAVDFRARVWLNGVFIGEHEGGFTPFEFEITDVVKLADNLLTVQVYDPQDNAEIPIGKQGSWYTRVSGIWQDVVLEWRTASFIDYVHVFPDIDRSLINIKTELNMAQQAVYEIEYIVTDHLQSDPVATSAGSELNDTLIETELIIPNCILWSPDTPHLYDLKVILKEKATGEIVDQYQTYFGMRKISFANGQLMLNHRPLFVRGALEQAYYPDTIYVAPSDEWIQQEIRLAKEMGFNLLRKHIKVEIPAYLYWADRMGMLIWAEPPNTVKWSEQSRTRFLSELKGMIKRDMNHPSILIWTLYNEEWGLEWDLANDLEKQEFVKQLYDEIKQLDPTRLICDNSGWIHVKTDINDYHRYFTLPEQISDWKKDIDDYMVGHPEQNYVQGYKPDGEPIIVSEFGVWGLPSVKKLFDYYGGEPSWFANLGDDTHREDFKQPRNIFKNFEKYQVNRAFGDMENLAEASQKRMYRAVKSLIEEMRKNPKINGYVVTEFTDIEWETNGWLDYMRDKKLRMDRAADFNGSLVVMVDQLKRNLWCGEQQSVDVIISNHDQQVIAGTLSWELTGTNVSGTIELQEGNSTYIKLPQAIQFTAPDVKSSSFHSLKLTLTLNGEVAAVNEEELTISPIHMPTSFTIYAYQMPKAFCEYLEKNGLKLTDSFEQAQAVITSSLDQKVMSYCRNGGAVLFLAEEGDRLLEKDQFTFRELVRGESWDRTSSFNYVDASYFAEVPLHPEMGWECDGLFPEYIVPFSNYNKLGGTIGRIVYMFGNETLPESSEIISGYFQGWIGQAGGSMLKKAIGQGSLILTTWKLKNTYGTHPIATQIIHTLLSKEIN